MYSMFGIVHKSRDGLGGEGGSAKKSRNITRGGRGVSERITKSLFYLIRNCFYVVKTITRGEGGQPKNHETSQGGRGGPKIGKNAIT